MLKKAHLHCFDCSLKNKITSFLAVLCLVCFFFASIRFLPLSELGIVVIFGSNCLGFFLSFQ